MVIVRAGQASCARRSFGATAPGTNGSASADFSNSRRLTMALSSRLLAFFVQGQSV
jgi:hypothetical protein